MLDTIADILEGLEETIISKLIDRAQFKANPVAYEAGRSGFTGEALLSLFDLRLRYQEEMDASFGRYCVPEERPFCRDLPRPKRTVNLPDTGLRIDDFDRVNMTAQIKEHYLSLLGGMCEAGDDGQYGSSVEHDVYALQAISRRIHYGALYVAESKYRHDPGGCDRLLSRGDTEGLLQMLTRKEVEERILERVGEKVARAQAEVNRSVRRLIEPETVLAFYRDCIIPLTKKGEAAYIENRQR
jgi:chorismate mutase